MLLTLIPAKPFDVAKQRLAHVLTAQERAALSRMMLARTIGIARSAVGSEPIVVVSPTDAVADVALAAGADGTIASTIGGLNEQLAAACAILHSNSDILVMHADLPLLTVEDVHLLLETQAQVVLAPDRHGRGTNAMLQRSQQRFFHFGENSRFHHHREAVKRGLTVACIVRQGLAQDLDEPEDLHALSTRNLVAMRAAEGHVPPLFCAGRATRAMMEDIS